MKYKLFAAAALLAFQVVGGSAAQSADYITNASEIVKKTDWKKMETVKVLMAERGDNLFYRPNKLVFKAGQPYKLEMLNKGKKKHYFTAPEFFKAIATRKAQSDKDGEIKAPYFLAFEMMAKGGRLDLYFVPVKKGEYVVNCTIDDHAERGMKGTIVVE